MAETKRLGAQMVELEAALKLERAKRFGDSSERGDSPNGNSPTTLDTEGESGENSSLPAAPPPIQPNRQQGGQPGHKGRGRSIPSDLPRQETFYELSEAERRCPYCGLAYAETTLTEDSEQIEVKVKAHVRRY